MLVLIEKPQLNIVLKKHHFFKRSSSVVVTSIFLSCPVLTHPASLGIPKSASSAVWVWKAQSTSGPLVRSDVCMCVFRRTLLCLSEYMMDDRVLPPSLAWGRSVTWAGWPGAHPPRDKHLPEDRSLTFSAPVVHFTTIIFTIYYYKLWSCWWLNEL